MASGLSGQLARNTSFGLASECQNWGAPGHKETRNVVLCPEHSKGCCNADVSPSFHCTQNTILVHFTSLCLIGRPLCGCSQELVCLDVCRLSRHQVMLVMQGDACGLGRQQRIDGDSRLFGQQTVRVCLSSALKWRL